MKRSLCLILFALAGCLDAEPMTEVRILGEVRSNQTGPIELWLMHQSYGKGPLKTQLAIIGTLILDEPGPIDWQILVPSDAGEGLTLYAWQDHNDDGAHCLPGTPQESAKTLALAPATNFTINTIIGLEPSCEGPTWSTPRTP